MSAVAQSAETLGSLPKELEQGESATETWQLNALGLVRERLTKFSLLGVPLVTTETWWPVRGKYRYGLSRQEFFLRVGRADLANQQTARNTTSDLLFYGGVAVALGGIALPFLVQGDNGIEDSGLLLGAAVFVAGFIATNVGTAISGPVIDRAEADRLAQSYNDALQRRIFSRSRSDSRGFPSTRPWIGYSLRF